MEKIKIGRKEYDIKKGDYLMDNGSILMFITGDRRYLKNSHTLKLTAKEWAQVDLTKLKKSIDNDWGFTVTYYTFK